MEMNWNFFYIPIKLFPLLLMLKLVRIFALSGLVGEEPGKVRGQARQVWLRGLHRARHGHAPLDDGPRGRWQREDQSQGDGWKASTFQLDVIENTKH